ncbi:hypothetical protein LJR230_002193 [Trinickia sp. LjRoot230]|uniref:trehalase family glycosidase n=1 Tax=Trinickia sp. LjRoot230 TaxID=3342288 RepID=UPI003ED05968
MQLRGTIFPEGNEIGERLTAFFGGADSKAFVDCRPKRPPEEIMKAFEAKLAAYHQQKALRLQGRATGNATPYQMWAGFDLASFIEENFERPDRPGGEWTIEPYPQKTLAEHIHYKRVENTLDMSHPPAGSSLIAVPKEQAIPSNRFAEGYCWDMLPSVMGELAAGNVELALNTLENMAHQIRVTGRVSNGNRDYYTRTQVATFAILCNRVADYTGNEDILVQYLPELMAEWRNYMFGADTVGPGQIFGSVAMLPDGQMLNVYHDFATGPRPEGWAEEVEVANEELKERSADAPVNPANVYEVKRQGARSGIDFSKAQVNPETGRGELNFSIPLQENAHLVMAEQALVRALRAGGYAEMADQMDAVRERRTASIQSTFFKKKPDGTWEIGAHYRTREGKLHPLVTSEIANALWAGTVPPDAVDAVVKMIMEELLTEWGLAASAAWDSKEQWDGERFWALPTMKAVEGLRRYGKNEEAKKVAIAFAENAWQTYVNTGHTFEKFGRNGQPASGGEYRVEADMTMTNETLQWLASIYPEVADILDRPMPPRPVPEKPLAA